MVVTRYKDAFTEVHTILNHLVKEDYEKIPSNVIEIISKNMNVEYKYEINEELDLYNQAILPETKAILFNLFRDYLSTPEQKEKIIKMQREERQKNEEEKRKKYDSLKMFKNINNSVKNEKIENNEEKSLLIVKESIFIRIINKIKNLFKSKRQ